MFSAGSFFVAELLAFLIGKWLGNKIARNLRASLVFGQLEKVRLEASRTFFVGQFSGREATW